MIDFFWRCYARAMSQPQPKWIQRLEHYEDDTPVVMPKLWQVMVTPLVILALAALLVLL